MINVEVNISSSISIVANFKTIINQVVVPATVENSDQSFSANVNGGGLLVLPDIKFTDSDGTITQEPAVKDLVATPCPVISGIAYHRPQITGQKTSYVNNDDGWNLTNGIYDYNPPAYPVYIALLDKAAADPFKTLLNNNIFGNKNRFTDDAGGQTYSNAYVLDHHTGLGWYKDVFIVSFTHDQCIAAATASTNFGFSNWRLPNINEQQSICSNGNGTGRLNYTPFSYNTAVVIHTSTAGHQNPNTWNQQWNPRLGEVIMGQKSVGLRYMMCRNHFN